MVKPKIKLTVSEQVTRSPPLARFETSPPRNVQVIMGFTINGIADRSVSVVLT